MACGGILPRVFVDLICGSGRRRAQQAGAPTRKRQRRGRSAQKKQRLLQILHFVQDDSV
jgi:hypothetical protein